MKSIIELDISLIRYKIVNI